MEGTIVSGAGDTEFAGVSIDSRTIAPGELYVAIRGERYDGGEFAPAAVAAGAGGVVVARGRGAPRATDLVVIEVADTVAALQALGLKVRRASGARLVAITGSAGKTTTKEITAEFLGVRYRVIRNRGNFNNHIGLPLSLIDLRAQPDVAVVELGMNHAGEISTLVRIAEPDVRVWTNVAEAHLGFFDSVDAIADAKAEILERATPATVLVANADDDRVAARMRGFAGRLVTFGIERPASVAASSIVDRGLRGVTATVTTPLGAADISSPLLGRGNLSNLLAAAAVAIEFDVPLAAIAERTRTLRAAPHRGEILRLSNGVVVIDDSYNANPTATRGALDVLAGEPTASRRLAVLGEMLELGRQAIVLHQAVGRHAAAAGIDELYAIGGDAARALARAAVAAGMPADAVRYHATSDEAADLIVTRVRPGDLVLVKGSRGVGADRVVDRLTAGGG